MLVILEVGDLRFAFGILVFGGALITMAYAYVAEIRNNGAQVDKVPHALLTPVPPGITTTISATKVENR